MKKIIAAAVATAFVAPAFAADVSVSGEVEYTYTNADGLNTFGTGTGDLVVSASETLDNGIDVSAYISIESANGANDAQDTLLELSGAFGTVAVGDDNDGGFDNFDDKADVASAGGGGGEVDSGVDTVGFITYAPNLGVDGLSAVVGIGAGDETNEEVVGYGLQYSVGGFAIAYGAADADDSDNDATHLSVSAEFGPVYVGIDSMSKIAGVDGDDAVHVGVTYDMGDITLYAENITTEDAENVDATDTVYGLEYDMGSVDVFLSQITDETAGTDAATEAESTVIGVEYKF